MFFLLTIYAHKALGFDKCFLCIQNKVPLLQHALSLSASSIVAVCISLRPRLNFDASFNYYYYFYGRLLISQLKLRGRSSIKINLFLSQPARRGSLKHVPNCVSLGQSCSKYFWNHSIAQQCPPSLFVGVWLLAVTVDLQNVTSYHR